MKIEILPRVTALVEQIAASLAMEVVDVEYRREGRETVLRIFIDKPGGVTLDDCSTVSRELSQVLDVEDFIPVGYNLEVSSPGLNRPLKKPSDFQRSVGKLIKVKTFDLMADDTGSKRKTFLGDLIGVEDDGIVVKLTEGQTARLPFKSIAKANLEFEF